MAKAKKFAAVVGLIILNTYLKVVFFPDLTIDSI